MLSVFCFTLLFVLCAAGVELLGYVYTVVTFVSYRSCDMATAPVCNFEGEMYFRLILYLLNKRDGTRLY